MITADDEVCKHYFNTLELKCNEIMDQLPARLRAWVCNPYSLVTLWPEQPDDEDKIRCFSVFSWYKFDKLTALQPDCSLY